MKKRLLPLLAGLVLAAVPTLCAQANYNNLSSSPGKAAPHVGMTRDEARKLYGEPFHRTTLTGGERWLYRLKFDEVYGRAFVPFLVSSDNVRLGTIDFGPDGRARSYEWQQTVSRQAE